MSQVSARREHERDSKENDVEDVGAETSGMKCPACGGISFVRSFERGEVTCTTCGLVITEKIIDRGPEWRAFTSEERDKRSRVGSPHSPTVNDRGLSTVIDWRD